jgi:hypothetical protein
LFERKEPRDGRTGRVHLADDCIMFREGLEVILASREGL